eukprot:6212912-Pleurochrysis_carterae.AAC.4
MEPFVGGADISKDVGKALAKQSYLALALRAHRAAPLSVWARPLKVVPKCVRAVELRVVSVNKESVGASRADSESTFFCSKRVENEMVRTRTRQKTRGTT